MLLGKKYKEEVKTEWAVILNRPEDELAKSRAAQAVSEVFPLTNEEAKELVESTPIVLLDQLSIGIAEQVKEYLGNRHVSCTVTSDTFAKRKCFRVIWPEMPNLVAILGKAVQEEENISQPVLPMSDIREISQTEEELMATSPIPSNANVTSVGNSALLEEQKQLKQLVIDLQKENENLRRELDKVSLQARDEERKKWNLEREKLETENLRLSGEKDGFKEENVKLAKQIAEFQRLIEEEKKHNLRSQETIVQSQTAELRAQLDSLRAQQNQNQEAVRVAQSEAQQFRSEWTRTQKILSEARSECEDLKRMLGEAQSAYEQLKEESDQIQHEFQERYSNLNTELEDWKKKAGEWNLSYANTAKENEYLRAHRSEELESLRIRNQQLSNQLEQAQRQIRDFVVQLEQQELVQKRMKIASDLVELEAKQKELSQKRQNLSSEIEERSETIKNISEEQSRLEDEIVKVRQAQKYVIEQAKLKEKKSSIRPKITNPDELADQSAGSGTPS